MRKRHNIWEYDYFDDRSYFKKMKIHLLPNYVETFCSFWKIKISEISLFSHFGRPISSKYLLWYKIQKKEKKNTNPTKDKSCPK